MKTKHGNPTMPSIHELATLTSKGQITLPKSIRQALGVTTGGKVRSSCVAAKCLSPVQKLSTKTQRSAFF